MTLKPHLINEKNNFISGWYINESLCDELIKYFEKNRNKEPGKLGSNEGRVNPKEKDSTDLCLSSFLLEEPLEDYLKSLSVVIEHYKHQYPECSQRLISWGIFHHYNIQRYMPGQGYHKWHCENAGDEFSLKRHLTFMTYLNDVTDGGETAWKFQNVKIKPEKGLTVIWPTTWMFTHKGISSQTQTKYIATGWYNFK